MTQVEIDQGKIPAQTIPQLVSALRQSVLAAAIECSTARILLDRGDAIALEECIDRLEIRIKAADHKMTLAMNEARR